MKCFQVEPLLSANQPFQIRARRGRGVEGVWSEEQFGCSKLDLNIITWSLVQDQESMEEKITRLNKISKFKVTWSHY